MNYNQKLYEIDTRVWIKQFGKDVKLSEVPVSYFKKLKEKGFDFIWFMGVWKTPVENIKYAFAPDLIKAYKKCLPDWKKEDVIGSPYAIDSYQVNPKLGSYDDLLLLKKQLNKIDLKLILDFIPNHFGCESSVVKKNPHYFLPGDEQLLKEEPSTYFRLSSDKNIIIAHGRDPFFPAWSDTAQLNYFSDETRSFMTEQLFEIAKYCDGVRCDMAMLILNNVFKNTWPKSIAKLKFKNPKNEFWNYVIKKVKKVKPNFILIGEVYWDLESELIKLGFDFTYYKHFLDMLINNDTSGIVNNLKRDYNYLNKLVYFLENHDEERAVKSLGIKKSIASAIILLTIPGMKLFYDGQLEGEKIKCPIQIGKPYADKGSKTIRDFYSKILHIINDETYKKGIFNLIRPIKCDEIDESYKKILAWYWQYNNDIKITIVNFSSYQARCKIKLSIDNFPQKIILKDLLTKANMKITSKKLSKDGFIVQLKQYQSRIVEVKF